MWAKSKLNHKNPKIVFLRGKSRLQFIFCLFSWYYFFRQFQYLNTAAYLQFSCSKDLTNICQANLALRLVQSSMLIAIEWIRTLVFWLGRDPCANCVTASYSTEGVRLCLVFLFLQKSHLSVKFASKWAQAKRSVNILWPFISTSNASKSVSLFYLLSLNGWTLSS